MTFKNPVENTVAKGENAGNQHFLLFQLFSTLFITNFNYITSSSANTFHSDGSEISLFAFGLTLYSTDTHFDALTTVSF